MFENRVQKRIFGLKREEVAGGWRRLHNEELQTLYTTSPNIVRVIKSRRLGNAVQVASVRSDEKSILHFGRKLMGRDHSEDLDVCELDKSGSG
jgi:hypothetical protein